MIIDDVMMVMIVMVGLAGMGVWRARKRYGSSEKVTYEGTRRGIYSSTIDSITRRTGGSLWVQRNKKK